MRTQPWDRQKKYSPFKSKMMKTCEQAVRYAWRTTVVEEKWLNKTHQRRHLSKCKKYDPCQTLMIDMSNMVIKVASVSSAESGRLTCLYKSHQVWLSSWISFQRKTPEAISRRITRSLINVEGIDTLVFKILSNTQPSSVQCPWDVATTDNVVQKT